MEELRSEMLEMRDMYLEDDVYQLQELRQQLEQVLLRPDKHAKGDLIVCLIFYHLLAVHPSMICEML